MYTWRNADDCTAVFIMRSLHVYVAHLKEIWAVLQYLITSRAAKASAATRGSRAAQRQTLTGC